MTQAGQGVVAGRPASPPRLLLVRWRRRAVVGLAAALAAGGVLLLLWRPALQAVGAVLVVDGELAPADLVVVSNSSAVADAFEAAALYRGGYAPRVLVPGSMAEPQLANLHALGIPQMGTMQLVRAVLEGSGVPAAAIESLPDTIEGTETEAALVAAFVQRQQARRILVVTARSHTARTRWLLRHRLPAEVEVIVRSPRDDCFDPHAWWRSRESTREVAFEYMRWANALLGDLWS
ncbi:MAG TPA: ElyC/SanA/YdcF family protein [Candidatus Dormibacteraeota bacterium]|nr:ElyC/SanA/YdcF family protein [Candidatus Dormibacteraeota bacterium]